MTLIQVNLNSATTEELFERLAWFFATANQVQICDAEGQSHSRIISSFPLARKDSIPTAFCPTERPCTEANIHPKLDATKSLLYLWRLVQIREDSRKHV